MEYSSNKPLALQVYKTAAEFKAHRLNRSEQCRLNSARSSLSKEARFLEKDFKLTKSKLENYYRRRLTVYESPLGSARSASLISGSDAFSARRASQAASIRRHSEWSIPNSMARGSIFQRRKTLGGAASALPSSRSYRHSRLSMADLNECDFCEQVAEIMEKYDRGASIESQSVVSKNHDVDANNSIRAENGTTDNPATEQPATDVVPNTEDTVSLISQGASRAGQTGAEQNDNGSEARGAGRQQSRAKVLSAFYPRRASRPTSVRYVEFSGDDPAGDETDGPASGPASKADNPTDKVGAKTEISKPELSVNFSEQNSPQDVQPQSIAADEAATQSPAQNDCQTSSGMSVNEYEQVILDHALHCSSGRLGKSRVQSVVFGNLRDHPLSSISSRRLSAPAARSDFVLESRVADFLDQQQEFNKRFPLKRHEVKSLQCARPDLLHVSRKQDELAKIHKDKKARMIEEVMNKLGLAETDADSDDTPFLPDITKKQ